MLLTTHHKDERQEAKFVSRCHLSLWAVLSLTLQRLNYVSQRHMSHQGFKEDKPMSLQWSPVPASAPEKTKYKNKMMISFIWPPETVAPGSGSTSLLKVTSSELIRKNARFSGVWTLMLQHYRIKFIHLNRDTRDVDEVAPEKHSRSQ